MRRRAPATDLLGPRPALVDELAPATLLARVQQAWPAAAGPAIAAAARPVAEHEGVLTVTCEAAVWAQELELMEGAAPGASQRRPGRARRRTPCGAAPGSREDRPSFTADFAGI